ncbi:hypothetical protein DFH09DRAFT_1076200 [Mycena vulgaris]|nr:hypothetical protein DFH09DRAFT_1076200 [Mycena vulgaris]
MAICQAAESSQARMVPMRKAPRARPRLPAQDQASLCKISSRKDQASLCKIKAPRAKITAPRAGLRLKATSARSFLSLFVHARARTTSRPSKHGLKTRHAPHLERHPGDGECSSPSPSPSLLALIPAIFPSSRRVGRHRVSREAAEANETSILRMIKATSTDRLISRERSTCAHRTQDDDLRCPYLTFPPLRRAPNGSLRSPPTCAALLARNGHSVECVGRTSRRMPGGGPPRATGTSVASARAGGQRAVRSWPRAREAWARVGLVHRVVKTSRAVAILGDSG